MSDGDERDRGGDGWRMFRMTWRLGEKSVDGARRAGGLLTMLEVRAGGASQEQDCDQEQTRGEAKLEFASPRWQHYCGRFFERPHCYLKLRLSAR